jgi:hypothetical protein
VRLGRDDARAERVVAQHAARELLVRDHDLLAAERAQERVVEPDVLDGAVVVVDDDPVADADRLGDGEHDPRDEVGERLARREAEDRRGDRARGEQRRGEPVDPLELRQRDRDADQDDHRVDEPAHEAQPGGRGGRQLAAHDGRGHLLAAPRQHPVDHVRQQQRQRDRDARLDPVPRRAVLLVGGEEQRHGNIDPHARRRG